jgi:hypothetical protein
MKIGKEFYATLSGDALIYPFLAYNIKTFKVMDSISLLFVANIKFVEKDLID